MNFDLFAPLLSAKRVSLNTFGLLRISGPDAEKFLQGQLTNDLTLLNENELQVNCRVDLSGKLKNYFMLGKDESTFIAILPKESIGELVEDLSRFIIMEDVILKEEDLGLILNLGLIKNSDDLNKTESDSKVFSTNFFGPICRLEIVDSNSKGDISFDELGDLLLLCGCLAPIKHSWIGERINDTPLNSAGVSYSKGCFYGQEALGKTQSKKGEVYQSGFYRTGFDYLPQRGSEIFQDNERVGRVIFSLNTSGSKYIFAKTLKKVRVLNKNYTFQIGDMGIEAKFCGFPVFKLNTRNSYIDFISDLAANLYTLENDYQGAHSLFLKCLEVDPKNEGLLEAIAVMTGNQGFYDEAIGYLNQLETLNPDNIMVYTNRSLFLMKQGKIEEAEREKDIATLKTFEQAGKKQEDLSSRNSAKDEEYKRKKSLFEKVLELDPDDELANMGMGEVFFHFKELEKAHERIEHCISKHPENSRAYLLLAKILTASNNGSEAVKTLKTGLRVSEESGDLQTANSILQELELLSPSAE